jgi:hypothetical protein
VSFGGSWPFHPLIDLLKRACGVDEADTEQVIGEKIEHAAARLGGERRPSAPFLRAMLSIDPGDAAVAAMDPKLRRAGMFEAVRQFLLASAEARPLVVMLEDVHWMDEATTEFLALMAESVESSRILLCVTHRTGFGLTFGEVCSRPGLTGMRLRRRRPRVCFACPVCPCFRLQGCSTPTRWQSAPQEIWSGPYESWLEDEGQRAAPTESFPQSRMLLARLSGSIRGRATCCTSRR